MEKAKKHWIKLKEVLESTEYAEITQLESVCVQRDQTTLKLEIDYKFNAAKNINGVPHRINEFLYYIGEVLVGYLGIGCFGGTTAELNGMVHPEYRRQGVFTKLSQLALEECRRQTFTEVLLLCDRNSISGQAFVKELSKQIHHSEYEMDLDLENVLSRRDDKALKLEKASNADAEEVGRQNALYFGVDYDPAHMIMPEEEERRGMTVYLAMLEGEVIGKTHLQYIDGEAGIFGLGIKPEHRGKGLGRDLLNASVERLKMLNPRRIMLQVEAKNETALNLYKSCGFVAHSTMDYYSYSHNQ